MAPKDQVLHRISYVHKKFSYKFPFLFVHLNNLPAAPRNPGDEDDANVEPGQFRQAKKTGYQERILLTQYFGARQRDDAPYGVAAARRQNVGDSCDQASTL